MAKEGVEWGALDRPGASQLTLQISLLPFSHLVLGPISWSPLRRGVATG